MDFIHSIKICYGETTWDHFVFGECQSSSGDSGQRSYEITGGHALKTKIFIRAHNRSIKKNFQRIPKGWGYYRLKSKMRNFQYFWSHQTSKRKNERNQYEHKTVFCQ